MQLPTKTTSILCPRSGAPGVTPMVRSTRSGASAGTGSVTAMAVPGSVPQVIIGASAEPSRRTERSKTAPSSPRSFRQLSSAAVQLGPLGARGRPSR